MVTKVCVLLFVVVVAVAAIYALSCGGDDGGDF